MEEAREVQPGVFDLSTIHRPISDQLYDTTDIQWRDYLLSDAHVNQFWRDGYVSNIRVLSEEQCDVILEDYAHFMSSKTRHPGHDLLYEYHSNQTGDPSKVLMHCLGHWRVTPAFHDLVFHPKVTAMCSQLVVEGQQTAVRFWHDQLFAKPPQHGSNVAWHQDYSYWTRTTPCQHVTVHIALDEQTDDNGGLMYIPGSHRWTRDGGPLPITDDNFKDMNSIKAILNAEELAAFQPRLARLKKGEASFHHSLAVHGSHENRSNGPRRAAVLNYFADGTRSATDGAMLVKETTKPELHTGADIPTGQKMEGEFYPVVFDTDWL